MVQPKAQGAAVDAKQLVDDDDDADITNLNEDELTAPAFHRWLRVLAGIRGVWVAKAPRGAHNPSLWNDIVDPRIDAPNLRSPAVVLPRAPAVSWALWRVATQQR